MDTRFHTWLEARQNALPTRTFKELYHIGTLDPKQKKKGSHEGAGLSVTTHPDEWARITPLSGDLWVLKKSGNKFIDFHELTDAQEEMLKEWGVRQGYITRATLYRLTQYDSEADSEYYTDFEREEDARAELWDDEDDSPISQVPGIRATPKFSAATNSREDETTMLVLDRLSTLFAEQNGYDGVWWEDELDVLAYSAPRGVIVPSQVKTWKFTKVK